jgi:DNA-directed RNA polymerase specialized sigma24 family protein
MKEILEKALSALRRYVYACEDYARYCSVISKPNIGDAGSSGDNSIEIKYIRAVYYGELLEQAERALDDARREAFQCIGNVGDPIDREILVSRYIHGESWRMIAGRMNYSVRQVIRRNNRTVREYEDTPEGLRS